MASPARNKRWLEGVLAFIVGGSLTLTSCQRQPMGRPSIVLHSVYFDVDVPAATPVQDEATRRKLEALSAARGLACRSEPEFMRTENLQGVLEVLRGAARRDGWEWQPLGAAHHVWKVASKPEMVVVASGEALMVCLPREAVTG